MSEVLKCKEVSRTYRSFSLKPMSFEVKKGYLTGLVGVNGAGKSTLLNILAGMDDAYHGEVYIGGKNLRTEYEEAKEKVALVSEQISYFMDKTPLENGELLGFYFKHWSMEELYIWLDRLEIPKGQPLYQLSKGMYMKYQLAFAMSHKPEFLLLDEPTAGFDPVFRKDFIGIVQDIRDRGIGVLMSTHIISDIDRVADYVMLIEGGELKLHDTREHIGNRSIKELLEQCEHKEASIQDILKRRESVR